jgi:hypothetical protein
MPHVRYVEWNPRHKRLGGYPTFNLIEDIGDLPTVRPAPEGLLGTGRRKVRFGFWSIGFPHCTATAKNPPVVNPSPTGLPRPLYTAWYYDTSILSMKCPIWGAQAHLVVDAFDLGMGDFINDPFVYWVFDPELPSGELNSLLQMRALTRHANFYGCVHFNCGSAFALPQVYETRVGQTADFVQWLAVGGNLDLPHETEILQAADREGLAFALYRSPGQQFTRFGTHLPMQCGSVIHGGVNDGPGMFWGPNGPVPVGPWDPYEPVWTALTLAGLANSVDPSLRSRLLDIAAVQLSRATRQVVRKTRENPRPPRARKGGK